MMIKKYRHQTPFSHVKLNPRPLPANIMLPRKNYPLNDEKHYKSDAFAAIHESMDALHQIGAISKKTMREFDETCLTAVEAIPAQH